MTDSTLNRFLASGTNAERLAFTPTPPTPGSGPDPTYIWHETDTGNTYAWDFDGAAWNQVNGGIPDGDKGDITVSSGTWTVDNGAISYAKMQDVSATSRLLGRVTAGAGDVEEVVLDADTALTANSDSRVATQKATKAYVDAAVSGGGGITALTGDVTATGPGSVAATIANDAVTYAKLQNVSATSRILGRKTAAAGDVEECTLSEILDFIGSAAQGDILYRGASGWARLGAGTAGYRLQTNGAGADPSWAASSAYTGGVQSTPILAAAMTPRTTNGAATGTTETTTNKIMLATLDFDQSTEEYAQFMFPMPKSWNESTVTAQFIWTAASGTGDVIWGIQGVAISNDDALDAAFGTAQEVTDTLLATNDQHTTSFTSAVTIGGTPAEGDLVCFQVYRKAANGSDTLTADAKLIGIRLNFTTNAADDS